MSRITDRIQYLEVHRYCPYQKAGTVTLDKLINSSSHFRSELRNSRRFMSFLDILQFWPNRCAASFTQDRVKYAKKFQQVTNRRRGCSHWHSMANIQLTTCLCRWGWHRFLQLIKLSWSNSKMSRLRFKMKNKLLEWTE
jgi:hypothetical protein